MAKRLSQEIRDEAVKMVEEHGIKHAQVIKELGIAPSTLNKLLKEYRTSASNGLNTNEKAELKKLRAKVRELSIEKDLLKKATVYFAKHSE